MRSFSLSTFRSNGTRSILFHLQIGQLQLISTDARGFEADALRTAGIVVAHNELTFAGLTTMAARTELDPQLKGLQVGLVNDGFKTEAQGVLIDGGHFADPN